jgi:SAM-dependent methyltransferase
LRFINPGMLSDSNIDLFEHCISRLPSDAPVLEIGSFAGLSLNHIIHLLRRGKRPNVVFSVDEWIFENSTSGTIGQSPVSFAAYRKHAIETFRKNVTLFSGDHLPHHIERNSDAFFSLWANGATVSDFFGRSVKLGGPLSFAYIDGAHTYEQSKRDFQNVDRFLEQGGFIVFDDSGDGSDWESNQTAKEAAASDTYELVAKNPNYCLRKL